MTTRRNTEYYNTYRTEYCYRTHHYETWIGDYCFGCHIHHMN